ncbi:Tyrosine-protein kinase Drl, partial [Armadillidium nasatum]
MGWTVKVAPDIHTLYFQWQALTKRPILYNVGVWVNETIEAKNPTPLAPPYVNISLSGTMPKRTGTFELNLPCTGLVNGEVDVIMNLNVTSPRPNQPPTVIYLKRKKICLK